MSTKLKRGLKTEDNIMTKKKKRFHSDSEEEESKENYGKESSRGNSSFWTPRHLNDLKTTSIYNRNSVEAPAELFRKDLISAMKLPDSEPLASDEFWTIVDQWKQEWERGVQVPVNPEHLPHPVVQVIKKSYLQKDHNFRLPKHKYIRITHDDFFSSDKHQLSTIPGRAERVCRYDLDEHDVQWLRILNGERAQMGLSPVSESLMEFVIEELELLSCEFIQKTVNSMENLGIEYDENVVCDVCRSPDSEEGNEMVFCDSCNICVHQFCYGITTIPRGSWLCCTCALGVKQSCVLCPNKSGAMKSTRSGQKWAHVSCALWIPEVSIGSVEKMGPITKISNIPASRWALVCILCKQRMGACIQCSVKTCKVAYHVTCAFKYNLEMRPVIEDEESEDGIKLRSYCLKHSCKTLGNINSDDDNSQVERLHRKKESLNDQKGQSQEERLQKIEAEFFLCMNLKQVSNNLEIDLEIIEYIYNYWKLRRIQTFNKPLLSPRVEDIETLTHKQEQDLERMKMFVHLRQDLERVRNLCYMVTRREKMTRSFFKLHEQIFIKQAFVLENSEIKLSTSECRAIRNANHISPLYDRLYSHSKAEDYSKNSKLVLSQINGEVKDFVKRDYNGIKKFKDNEENPYKRTYINGSERRRLCYESRSSGCTSDSDNSQQSYIKSHQNYKHSGTLCCTKNGQNNNSSDESSVKSVHRIKRKNSIYTDSETELSDCSITVETFTRSTPKLTNRLIKTKASVKDFSKQFCDISNKASLQKNDKNTFSEVEKINKNLKSTFTNYRYKDDFKNVNETVTSIDICNNLSDKKKKSDVTNEDASKEIAVDKNTSRTKFNKSEDKMVSGTNKGHQGDSLFLFENSSSKCHLKNGLGRKREIDNLKTKLLDKNDVLPYVPQRQAAKKATENISGIAKSNDVIDQLFGKLKSKSRKQKAKDKKIYRKKEIECMWNSSDDSENDSQNYYKKGLPKRLEFRNASYKSSHKSVFSFSDESDWDEISTPVVKLKNRTIKNSLVSKTNKEDVIENKDEIFDRLLGISKNETNDNFVANILHKQAVSLNEPFSDKKLKTSDRQTNDSLGSSPINAKSKTKKANNLNRNKAFSVIKHESSEYVRNNTYSGTNSSETSLPSDFGYSDQVLEQEKNNEICNTESNNSNTSVLFSQIVGDSIKNDENLDCIRDNLGGEVHDEIFYSSPKYELPKEPSSNPEHNLSIEELKEKIREDIFKSDKYGKKEKNIRNENLSEIDNSNLNSDLTSDSEDDSTESFLSDYDKNSEENISHLFLESDKTADQNIIHENVSTENNLNLFVKQGIDNNKNSSVLEEISANGKEINLNINDTLIHPIVNDDDQKVKEVELKNLEEIVKISKDTKDMSTNTSSMSDIKMIECNDQKIIYFENQFEISGKCMENEAKNFGEIENYPDPKEEIMYSHDSIYNDIPNSDADMQIDRLYYPNKCSVDDSFEDSARETLHLVEKLRSQYAKVTNNLKLDVTPKNSCDNNEIFENSSHFGPSSNIGFCSSNLPISHEVQNKNLDKNIISELDVNQHVFIPKSKSYVTGSYPPISVSLSTLANKTYSLNENQCKSVKNNDHSEVASINVVNNEKQKGNVFEPVNIWRPIESSPTSLSCIKPVSSLSYCGKWKSVNSIPDVSQRPIFLSSAFTCENLKTPLNNFQNSIDSTINESVLNLHKENNIQLQPKDDHILTSNSQQTCLSQSQLLFPDHSQISPQINVSSTVHSQDYCFPSLNANNLSNSLSSSQYPIVSPSLIIDKNDKKKSFVPLAPYSSVETSHYEDSISRLCTTNSVVISNLVEPELSCMLEDSSNNVGAKQPLINNLIHTTPATENIESILKPKQRRYSNSNRICISRSIYNKSIVSKKTKDIIKSPFGKKKQDCNASNENSAKLNCNFAGTVYEFTDDIVDVSDDTYCLDMSDLQNSCQSSEQLQNIANSNHLTFDVANHFSQKHDKIDYFNENKKQGTDINDFKLFETPSFPSDSLSSNQNVSVSSSVTSLMSPYFHPSSQLPPVSPYASFLDPSKDIGDISSNLQHTLEDYSSEMRTSDLGSEIPAKSMENTVSEFISTAENQLKVLICGKENHDNLNAKNSNVNCDSNNEEINNLQNNNANISAEDSRLQLKVKIKGPFLDSNYNANTVSATCLGLDASKNVSTICSLRRMRKKELIRQYQNQDNPDNLAPLDASLNLAMQNNVPRTIITIPKAVASMAIIPTREDYISCKDSSNTKQKTKKRDQTKLRGNSIKHVKVMNHSKKEETLENENDLQIESTIKVNNCFSPTIKNGEKRCLPPPKLRISLSKTKNYHERLPCEILSESKNVDQSFHNESVRNSKLNNLRMKLPDEVDSCRDKPIKKRIPENTHYSPCQEPMEKVKEDNLKFRKVVMARFEHIETSVHFKSRVKRLKKDVHNPLIFKKKTYPANRKYYQYKNSVFPDSEFQILSSNDATASKLIIRLGKKNDQNSSNGSQLSPKFHLENSNTLCKNINRLKTSSVDKNKTVKLKVNLSKNQPVDQKIMPIRLKLLRNSLGYVMETQTPFNENFSEFNQKNVQCMSSNSFEIR